MNNISTVKYRQIEERAEEVARYIVDNKTRTLVAYLYNELRRCRA